MSVRKSSPVSEPKHCCTAHFHDSTDTDLQMLQRLDYLLYVLSL